MTTPHGRPGIPDRRSFLVRGAAIGASSLVAACGWNGGPLAGRLRSFSSVNDRVSALLFSGRRLAREYPTIYRTPDARFPSYYVSGGMPTLADAAAWRLSVGGLVRRPGSFSLEQIQALPRFSYTVKHHCVEGWTAIASWSGAPFSALAAQVEPLPGARYVNFRSFDAGYSNGWDIASALHPQTMLAWGHNDRPLMPDHGAPLRLYAPTKLGYKLTKYLLAIDFTAEQPGGYWEDQGYPWFGGL